MLEIIYKDVPIKCEYNPTEDYAENVTIGDVYIPEPMEFFGSDGAAEIDILAKQVHLEDAWDAYYSDRAAEAIWLIRGEKHLDAV